MCPRIWLVWLVGCLVNLQSQSVDCVSTLHVFALWFLGSVLCPSSRLIKSNFGDWTVSFFRWRGKRETVLCFTRYRQSHMLPPGSLLHRFLLANKHKVLEASFGCIISRRVKPIVLRPSGRAGFCPRKQLLKLYALRSKRVSGTRSKGCMCQS